MPKSAVKASQGKMPPGLKGKTVTPSKLQNKGGTGLGKGKAAPLRDGDADDKFIPRKSK